MKGLFQRWPLLLATALLAYGAGVAWACNGNYGEPWDTGDCIVTDVVQQDSCCVAQDLTQIKRCATCLREIFLCIEGDLLVERAGPAFNCGNPGGLCL